MPQPIDPPTKDQLEVVRAHVEREAKWLDDLHARLLAHGLMPLHETLKIASKAHRAVRELEAELRQCIRDGVRPNRASVAERNAGIVSPVSGGINHKQAWRK
jgi:hypothetical protein